MAATQLTAQTVVVFALEQIGVYGVGQTLQASDANTGLRRANAMISSWSTQSLTIPTIQRSVFDLTANVGGYTIGPGGTFNTIRPTSLYSAALLLNSSTPAQEIVLSVLTEQEYVSIPIKSQTSTQPTSVFYNPTFVVSGLGQIALWPIPTTADNDLVLYFRDPLREFPDLTTQYYVPPGYEEALGYNLALRLAPIYARPVPDDVRTLAKQSLAQIKRNNTKMSDLVNDAAGIGGPTGIYDAYSDMIR